MMQNPSSGWDYLLHNILSYLLFTSYSILWSTKTLTMVQHIHHDMHTKTSLKNQRKTSLNPFWRRLHRNIIFGINGFCSITCPWWWYVAQSYTHATSMIFHRKTHTVPIMAGFPKLEEKFHSLEPLGTTS